MIYLDYAANTPADPAVLAAFCETESRFPANPNARHPMGRAARAELARITDSVSALLGVGPEAVIYTSGATESNNLAVKGLVQANPSGGRHILTTPLEHPSVRGALAWLEGQGYQVEELPLRSDGRVDLARLPGLVREDTVLATVCAVDSETGVVQPVREMGELLRQFPNCRFHVDAVQAVGKLELSLVEADTVSIAPHKFYGLNGSGLLLKRGCVPLAPQIHGGASATDVRSGTPTLALAAATEAALSLALAHQTERLEQVAALNARLREELSRRPQVRINSPANASPYILNLSVRNVLGTVLQRELGKRGSASPSAPPVPGTERRPGRCWPSQGTGATPCPPGGSASATSPPNESWTAFYRPWTTAAGRWGWGEGAPPRFPRRISTFALF